MHDDRRRQIEEIFDAALDHDPGGWEAFLDRSCAGDRELIAEVRALLAAHELAERLFDQPEDPAASSSRIGPYRVVREIGRGGMGIVYLAERADGQFERSVAIKLISATRADDPLYQRLLSERQILAGLDHPHIARLLDGDITDDGRPYLVLEYVDGVPITTYCDEHRLGIDSRLKLFVDVCRAVQHAHQKLVIHRDLKPANILVTPQGQVRLLDFGIAKLLASEPGPHSPPVTRAGFRIMTPEYASPEQVRGDPLTTSSDIYTLGVLLYELLTGCPPYEVTTASPMEAMRLVCEQDPERPSTRAVRAGRPAWGSSGSATTANERAATRGTHPERLRRRLQGELDAIVLTAMRKEPGLRYGSADLLAQDIVRHLDGLPVTAHAGSTVHRVRRFVRRHRVETVAAALVALSLVAGAGVAAWQAALADSARDRAEGARANAEEVALFLSGLFGAADPLAPTAERIDTLRAGQLLDRGAARVRQELADQPLVRAQLLDVVGRVYHNLGRYEDARAALEEALSIRQGHLGERHQEVAETLTHLGVVLVATDDFDGAGDRLKRALAIDRQVWGAEHPRVAEDLHHLATAYRESGRFPEAIQHHLEALRIMRETAGDSDPRLPTFLRELVATLERQGNYVEAERYSRESVMLHRRLFGDGHAMLATPLRDLGFLLQRNGEFAAAEGLFREAYAIAIGTVGERHPQTADLLNRLASVRAWQNDFHAADSIHREAIDLKRQLYGDTHLEVAYSLSNLAWVKRQQHDYTQADSLHRAALEVVRTVVGREHSAYWIMLGGRGRTLQAAGECEAAEPLLRESSEGLRRTMPAEPYRVALNQISLGACAIARDRFSDAEKILLESHAALKPRGAQDSFVLEVSEQLVSLYTSWGRPKDALRYDVNSRIPLPP